MYTKPITICDAFREKERTRDREKDREKDRPAREARDRADRSYVERAKGDREAERSDRDRYVTWLAAAWHECNSGNRRTVVKAASCVVCCCCFGYSIFLAATLFVLALAVG